MKFAITDYKGPTGPYVATGKEILPLSSLPGMIAATGAGIQAGVGDQQAAEKLQEAIDKAVAKTLAELTV